MTTVHVSFDLDTLRRQLNHAGNRAQASEAAHPPVDGAGHQALLLLHDPEPRLDVGTPHIGQRVEATSEAPLEPRPEGLAVVGAGVLVAVADEERHRQPLVCGDVLASERVEDGRKKFRGVAHVMRLLRLYVGGADWSHQQVYAESVTSAQTPITVVAPFDPPEPASQRQDWSP